MSRKNIKINIFIILQILDVLNFLKQKLLFLKTQIMIANTYKPVQSSPKAKQLIKVHRVQHTENNLNALFLLNLINKNIPPHFRITL